MDRDKAADIEDKEYSEESVEDCQPDSEDDEQTYIYQLAKIKDERLNTVVEADATMENSTLTLDKTEEIDEKQKGSERKDRPSRNAMDSESSYENSDEEGKKGTLEVPETDFHDDSCEKSSQKISIKNFALLGILGESSFGTVHHVICKNEGKEYALKIISKRNISQKQQNEIQRERSFLAEIDHPNIVKIHKCFHDKTNLYLAMDCCPNGELHTFMKNEGILSKNVAQFLAAEIVNMISYLKDRNICHRDIKPKNLVFDENMHLKLIDFGCGKYYKDTKFELLPKPSQSGAEGGKEFQRTSTFLGTCEYTSPEVVGGAYANSAADLWSLGVLVYMFFTEYAPFRGEYDQDTLNKICEDHPFYPENFPEDAQDLCTRLLEKDPTKRLGAGAPGSENDMTALRSHKFFDNIDFDNLFETTSPIPKVDKMMNSIKSNMISKYAIKNKSKRKRPKSPVKAKTSIDLSHFNVEPLETQDKMKIEDWKTEKKINITHTELIQLRSRLLFFYRSVISLTTDEPALYIYGLKSGVLRERYDLKNCKINIKGKNKIKLASKTKEKYKKISNAFKIKKHQKHHRDSTNPKGLVDVLKEIKTQ